MSLVLRTPARDPFDLLNSFFTTRPTKTFAPAFEAKETPDAYVLKADLPGIAEADLDVSVHNSVLTVAGKREAEQRKDGESYSLYERQFGTFTRSFQLPETADGERVEAKLEAGVLTLTIGKRVEAKPRKIALKK
jgi:HSP20 family protein